VLWKNSTTPQDEDKMMPCLPCLLAHAKPICGKLRSCWNIPAFIAKLNHAEDECNLYEDSGESYFLVRPNSRQVTKAPVLCAIICGKETCLQALNGSFPMHSASPLPLMLLTQSPSYYFWNLNRSW